MPFEVDESPERHEAPAHVGPLPDVTVSERVEPTGRVAEPEVVHPDIPAMAVDGLVNATRGPREQEVPTSPPPEERKPEAPEDNSETAEQEYGPKLQHVERITKTEKGTTGNAGEFMDGNRANLRSLIEAGRRGEKQVMRMSRKQADGPVKIEVTRALRPAHSKVAPETPASADPEAENPTAENVEPPAPTTWALLESKQASVTGTQQMTIDIVQSEDSGPIEEGFDLRRVLADYDGPFEVEISADPVDTATQKRLEQRTAFKLEAVQNSEGETEREGDLNRLQDRLREGSKTAMFSVGIAVGANDPEALAGLVQHINNALPVGRFNWSEKTNDQGEMATYSSSEAALAAKSEQESLTTAPELRVLAQFPPTAVPGLEVRNRAETFAVERNLPEGVQSTRIGRSLDNEGNEVPGERGEVRVTDKEHFGVFGASGTGKTTLLHEDIVQTIVDAYQRGDDVGVLIADCEKIGNHNGLANALEAYRFPDGTGLPDEWKQIRIIRPGEDGLRAILEPFKIAGNNSPAKQLEEGVHTMASGIVAPEEYHLMVKYSQEGMMDCARDIGTDPEDARPTNGGRYAEGTEKAGQEVIMPTVEMGVPYIMRAIDRAKCEQKIKDNLKNYISTEYAKVSTGVDQAVYQNGNPIDGRALVQAKGATIVELGALSDAGKAIAASGLIRLSVRSLESIKTSPGDVHKTRFKLIVDEANIFDKNRPGAAEIAHYAAYARGAGMQFVVAKTTWLDVIHPDLMGNLRNIAAFNLTRAEDVAAIASQMGNASPQDIKSYLASVPTLEGLYYGPYMPTGPVRVRLDNPRLKPPADGRRNIKDARDIVDMGIDPRVFDGYTKTAASRMLRDTPEGGVLTAWTQLNAFATATGLRLAGLEDTWRERIAGYSDAQDIDRRDAAITKSMEWAVKLRPDIPDRMAVARDQVGEHIRAAGTAEERGMPLEERMPRVDRAMPQFRYRPLKAELETKLEQAQTQMPKLDATLTGRYEKSLGRIGGETAQQQLDSVRQLKANSIEALTKTISGVTSMNSETAGYVAREIAKQIGGYGDVETGITFVRQQIEDKLGRRLSEAETANYNQAAAEAKSLQDVLRAGFPLAQRDLQRKIDSAPGIKMKDWNALYRETFPEPQEGAGTPVTLKDQLRFVEEKQRAYNRQHRVRDANLSDLFFVEHPAEGGIVWDRVLDKIRDTEQEYQGRMFQQQQRRYNNGQLPTFELTELLRTNPEGAKQWSQAMKDLLYGGYFRMHPETQQFIAGAIDATVSALRKNAEKMNALATKKQGEDKE